MIDATRVRRIGSIDVEAVHPLIDLAAETAAARFLGWKLLALKVGIMGLVNGRKLITSVRKAGRA